MFSSIHRVNRRMDGILQNNYNYHKLLQYHLEFKLLLFNPFLSVSLSYSPRIWNKQEQPWEIIIFSDRLYSQNSKFSEY